MRTRYPPKLIPELLPNASIGYALWLLCVLRPSKDGGAGQNVRSGVLVPVLWRLAHAFPKMAVAVGIGDHHSLKTPRDEANTIPG